MTYTNITNPLDLQTIFVNTFAGSMEIFFFIALAVFAFLSAKLRMPNQVFLILMVLFVILMAGYTGNLLYVLVLAIIGLLIYLVISNIIKK